MGNSSELENKVGQSRSEVGSMWCMREAAWRNQWMPFLKISAFPLTWELSTVLHRILLQCLRGSTCVPGVTLVLGGS